MKAVNKVKQVEQGSYSKEIDELFDGRMVARVRVSGNHDYSDIYAKVINPRT